MKLSELYKCMADDSRLRLLHILSHGQFNVGELTAILSLSQPTVSHHLKVLERAGLVDSQKQGTWAYYTSAFLGSGTDEEDNTDSPQALVNKNFLDILSLSAGVNGFSEIITKDKSAIEETLTARRDRSRKFFDSVASKWKDIRAELGSAEQYLDEVIQRVPSDASFLDLGCGSGALLERALPRDTGETFAVDYSEAMLKEARSLLGERASLVDFRLGYLEHLPFGDDTIDFAVAYMVFHHLPDPRLALKDIRRVLKPQGSLLVVDLLRHEREEMRDTHADLWLGFEPDGIAKWANELGFSVAERKNFDEEVFLLTFN